MRQRVIENVGTFFLGGGGDNTPTTMPLFVRLFCNEIAKLERLIGEADSSFVSKVIV